MKPKRKGTLGPRLRAKGFDRSYFSRSDNTWHIACSQCEALVINSVPCHEAGCLNQLIAEQEEEWQS